LIFISATNDTPTTPNPTRFLSRYDKSANNILESSLWTSLGQTPWSEPYSHWYHRYVEFPFRALECASKLGEYTITDKGTWCSVAEEVRTEMEVFVSWFFFQLTAYDPGELSQ
jgi:ABC-type tungstate transport system permease subunit